jgi:hypothetical protein
MDGSSEQLHAVALRAFQDRLGIAEPIDIVREMITHGQSAILNVQEYSYVRRSVGESLGVSPNRDVFMVGSAKLGFSIKAAKRYEPFGDDSDIDIAVTSPELYHTLWSEVRRFGRQGGAWPRDDRNHFKNDHLNAVIKPYVIPDSATVPTRRRLFDLQSRLQRLSYSPYPVTLAVWHSIEALEDYQSIAVGECQQEVH